MTLGRALALASLVKAGYIYQDEDKSGVRMDQGVTIELPSDVIARYGTMTFFGRSSQNSPDEFPFPFAAKFGWDIHDQGTVSCLVPGSAENSWSRVVQYTTLRGDANNPATNCEKNETVGVDCVNWVEPGRLKEICIPLLIRWKSLNHD